MLAAVGVLGLVWWALSPTEPAVPPGAAPTARAGAEAIAAVPASTVALGGVGAVPPPAKSASPLAASERDLADVVGPIQPGQEPSMTEVIDKLRRAGVRSGLAAFNPPGTKPVLVGLAVPPDFPLPPGFVRHHQTTDDGQAVEAILRYAPDYQPVDAAGRPLPVPPDRVVPPEGAPPGLPIRRIVIPPPLPPVRP